MRMELQHMDGSSMDAYDDDGYMSDSEAFAYVVDTLTGVARAPSMVDPIDRDRYNELVGFLNPVESVKDEGMLSSTLKALSGAVTKLDAAFHAALLSNIFDLSIWNYHLETREAVLELIVSLAAVPDKFLDGCLLMIVNNFKPPLKSRQYASYRWLETKRKVHGELYEALHCISNLVPLSPLRLKDIIDKSMPRSTAPKDEIETFVECMLGLENDEIGEFIGNMLLAKVVELLIDLDVNISWEDIQQEDHNRGIFDIELEDMEESAVGFGGVGSKPSEQTTRILKGNVFAEKLDCLMVIVCEHLEARKSSGHLVKVFETLKESFRKTVMNAYKSKFAQFVMFYACSLDPEMCGLNFAVMLTDIFLSSSEDPISRMSSIAYLASYLSRAKFIPSSFVGNIILKRLVEWCFEYCQVHNSRERTEYPKAHRVFYSGCQAVLYILCFRMRSLMDVPNLRSLLFHLPLETILCSHLNPLKVCWPDIVHEFLQQVQAAQLFKASTTFLYDNLVDSEFSKDFRGMQRLDWFFPFDPYLLKDSDRFMRPNFEFWSMVKTSYSDYNSDDELKDLDDLETTDNVGPLDGHDESESDEEIEYYMNKMSITPKASFHHPMAANLQNGSQMPARIRPSVSP